MHGKKNKDLNGLLHPYTFVLQEGKAIRKNYLDFSLLLLWSRPEFINNGLRKKKASRR